MGLDVHREFAQVAVWEDGLVRQAGRIALTDDALRMFADSLGPEDEVAIEATCNTQAIVRLLEPHAARVVVSNPQKTRRQLVADWQAKGPTKPKPEPGVAAASGTRLKRPSMGQAARQASVPEPALRSGVDHALSKA